MTDVKSMGNYPFVYDSKVLNPITPTGIRGDTRIFESVKQGGKRSHSKRSDSKRSKKKSKKYKAKYNTSKIRNNRKNVS
jgi:hypothetical protein